MPVSPKVVQIHRDRGFALNISETGALVRVGASKLENHTYPVLLDLESHQIRAMARIVRCVEHRLELEQAAWSRVEHLVGLEFLNLSPESRAVLRDFVAERLAALDPDPTPEPGEAGAGTRERIALVIPNEVRRTSLASLLAEGGWIPQVLDLARLGLDAVVARRPALIVIDLSEERESLWKLVEDARRDERTRLIPMLAISVPAGGLGPRAKELGETWIDLLPKTATNEDFCARVRALLGKKAESRIQNSE